MIPVIAFGQKRADQLPEISSPADTDIMINVRGGSFYKTTFANLKTYVAGQGVDSVNISNDTLFIYLPSSNVFTVLPDASATNEIQTISKSGSTVTLSNSGGSFTDAVDDADASTTNEIQTLSIDSTGTSFTISLSDGGGSVTFEDTEGSGSTPTLSQVVAAGSTTGGSISMSGFAIINVATPTNGNWAANKSYVDSAVSGTSLSDVGIQRGEGSFTTDGSGRFTVTHSIGAEPVFVGVTDYSANGYTFSIPVKGGLTFTVEVRDTSGSLVTSTSIDIGWMATE